VPDSPNIFGYIDYRQWLADESEHLKATTRYFSHRWFAQAAGIKNPSLFSQVVAGKRNLSPALVASFTKVFELGSKESRFFRHLVQFNQATTALEKQEHYALLREMAGSVRQVHLEPDAWDFYRHWWIPALRELVAQRGTFANWAHLAAQLRPHITAKQAQAGIETLLGLGLIEQNEAGLWRQTHKALTSGEEVRALAIRNHNRQMAQLGMESIERFSPDLRHVTGITLGLSSAGLQLLSAEIQAFRERVVRLVDQDTAPGEVYQFNVQLFPLSAKGES
jgi:uncharacterized protein (TIGR02147 family)